MKKFVLFFAAVLLAIPAMSFACDTAGCYPQPAPLSGSSEAQAFQHMDLSYGQDAGVQKIDQFTVTKTRTEKYEVDADVYGSIHVSPDTLFFVGLSGEIIKTNIDSFSTSKVCADLNTMSGTVSMAADAGVSAASTGFAGASSVAGNSGGVTQTQTLAYKQGGTGIQTASVYGYTGVSATSGIILP